MSLVAFFILVFTAASTGAIFQPGSWYERLAKPAWTPPDWAFPVVWAVLYIMIAFAGWLVWREAGWSLALLVWLVQLAANAAWSWLFFGLRRMDLAFIDVSVMWITIAGFILLAWPISQLAALLFLPYLAWTTTAGLLNLTVMRLNPGETRGPRGA